MPKISFCFCYESGSEHFMLRYEMEASLSKGKYAPKLGSVAGFFGESSIWPSREQALKRLFRAISLVRFMECTGVTHPPLIQHQAFYSELTRADRDARPNILDHWRVWSVSARPHRMLAANEPYVDGPEGIAAWCAANKWEFASLPAGYGFWSPPATKLFLMSPVKMGVSLSSIAAAVLENVPRIQALMPALERLRPLSIAAKGELRASRAARAAITLRQQEEDDGGPEDDVPLVLPYWDPPKLLPDE
jgi:hypothetical protein